MSKLARNTSKGNVAFCGSLWIGVDVHKKTYAIAILDQEGQKKHFSMPADNVGLVKKLQSYKCPIELVVYEAGPCGFSLYRSLMEAGITAMVAAPSRIPRTVGRSSKTDKLDCQKLAEYAARDMLVPVRVPTIKEAGIRKLQRRRHKLTDSIRVIKTQIKSSLLDAHIVEPLGLATWSKASIESLKTLTMDIETRLEVNSLLKELDFLRAERKIIDEHVWENMETHMQERVNILKTIPGVGDTLARSFATEIFRPERFPTGEHLTSYVGLAPLIKQSGQSKAYAYIAKTGQSRLRSMLVECAWQHIRYDVKAREFYNRILARSGTSQKAIVAVARRFAKILWRLSIERRAYTP